MTAATDPSGETTSYGFDGAGNRTSVKVGTAPAEETTYDAAGRPASGTGGIAYTHDEAGNLTSIDRPGTDEDLTATYDPWGRTASAVPGGLGSPEVAYTYDALSRTTRRTEGLEETTYAYTGLGESPAKLTESLAGIPGDQTLLAHSPSGPLAQQTGTGGAKLLISDLHTDVVGIASPSGTPEGARSYSAWGEPREDGLSSPLGYQGDLTDPSTGLVDMGTRLYAPTLGRFTTLDVLFGDPSQPLTLNQYAYGVASPLTNTDPTGMCSPQFCVDPGYHGEGHKQKHKDGTVAATGSGSNGATDSWSTPGYVPVHEPPRPVAKPKTPKIKSVDVVDVVFRSPDNIELTLMQCSSSAQTPHQRMGCLALRMIYEAGSLWFDQVPPQEVFDPSKGQVNPASPDYRVYCHNPWFTLPRACVPSAP
jgi:RHS repeat-associated protein